MKLSLPKVGVPNVKYRDSSCAELLELQIEPCISLAPIAYDRPEPQICPMCGRDERKVERIVIDVDSVPSHMNMFRIKKFWTYIIVTEQFKDAVTDLQLTNITFEEVELY